MNENLRLPLTILLAVVFILVLTAFLNLIVISTWLAGYTPYYGPQLIAEVTIDPQETDENGSFHRVNHQPFRYRNALRSSLQGQDFESEKEERSEYKAYGSEITFAARFIEAHSNVILFGFERAYAPYFLGENYLATETDAIWEDLQDGPNIFNQPFFARSFSSSPKLIVPRAGGSYQLWVTEQGVEWRNVD